MKYFAAFLICAVLLSFAQSAQSEEEIATGKFVVSFVAINNQKPWVVKALEHNVYNDLSGYARVVPMNKSPDERDDCADRNVDCLLDIYTDLQADAVMLGYVGQSSIDYEVYDIQKRSLVNSGSIPVGYGSSLLKLRMGAFNAFKPFLQKGGILDRRAYKAKAEQDGNFDVPFSRFTLEGDTQAQMLMFLAIFTCIPYILSFLGRASRNPYRQKSVTKWFMPFNLFFLAIIAYNFISLPGAGGALVNSSMDDVNNFNWMLPLIAGMAWGYFLFVNFRYIIPHLQGIERIRQRALWPVIKALFTLFAFKAVLIGGFYYAFFTGMMKFGEVFQIPQEFTILFLFPIAGLYICYWIALMVEVFAMIIDARIFTGNPHYAKDWNQRIKKYLISHLKRNGVTLDRKLVEDIVFIPGRNKGVVCYGGVFSAPRIAIERELLEFAMPEGEELIKRQKALEAEEEKQKKENNSTTQTITSLKKLTKEQKTQKRSITKQFKNTSKLLGQFEGLLIRDFKKPKKRTGKMLSENYMKGVIVPTMDGSNVMPLLSDGPNELKVVEDMLLMSTQLDKVYDEDAEVDDSSEKDKDFLFGILLHRIGSILRLNNIASTASLFFRFRKYTKKEAQSLFFSKYSALIGDTFVVLNFGLNNLMQYLYYRAKGTTNHLTARGSSVLLMKSQGMILTEISNFPEDSKKKIFKTDEISRIIWLSKFSQETIEDEKAPQIRKIKNGLLAIATIGFMIAILIHSYNYHPEYLEIIETERQEIEEAKEKAKEKERKKNEQQPR